MKISAFHFSPACPFKSQQPQVASQQEIDWEKFANL